MLSKVFQKMFKDESLRENNDKKILYLENLGEREVTFYSQAFQITPYKKNPRQIVFSLEENPEEFLLCSGRSFYSQSLALNFKDPRDAKSAYDFLILSGGESLEVRPLTCRDRYRVTWTFHIEQEDGESIF